VVLIGLGVLGWLGGALLAGQQWAGRGARGA